MSDELERALVLAPDDLQLWSVYADRLEDAGDTDWSSWIQLHLALEAATPSPRVLGLFWLSVLGVKIPRGGEPSESATVAGDTICKLMASETAPVRAVKALLDGTRAWRCKLALRHGLVARAEIGITIEDDEGEAADAGVHALCASPFARFVQYVRVTVEEHNYAERHFSALVTAMSAYPHPALASIELDGQDMLPIERMPGTDLDVTDAEVAALFAVAPRLDVLDLRWMQVDGGLRRTYRRTPKGIVHRSRPYARSEIVRKSLQPADSVRAECLRDAGVEAIQIEVDQIVPLHARREIVYLKPRATCADPVEAAIDAMRHEVRELVRMRDGAVELVAGRAGCGYGNLFRALDSIARWLDDARFFVSVMVGDDRRWIDDYRICLGTLEVLREGRSFWWPTLDGNVEKDAYFRELAEHDADVRAFVTTRA